MRLSLATTALFVTVTALFGCDEGKDGAAMPSGRAVQIAQFPAEYAQTSCAQNFKCCPPEDLTGHTMQQCTDDNASGLTLLSTLITDGQSKHRLGYDAVKMGACLTAVGALSCDGWKKGFTVLKNQPAVCKEAVFARVSAGGACAQDIECTTGHCEGADFGVTPAVDGKCTRLPTLGASCAGDFLCADGFYCDADSQICLDRKGAGASCASDEECLNACNIDKGVCSAYVGCAVADAAPRPALLASLLIAAAVLIGKRHRRGGRQRS